MAGSRREGKQLVFTAGLICSFIAFVCLFLAFSTPFWIQSWPRVHSGFKRLGLWEACFAGLVLERDPTQKAYHGCWWILAKEYWDIRSWVMPWWFIICQILTTLCFVAELIDIIILFVVWVSQGGTKKDQNGKNRVPTTLVQTGTILTVATMIGMLIVVLLFGIAVKVDERAWMPDPYLNYLSWSYGLAVVSVFFSIFATIAQVTYTIIVRQELREPPRSAPQVGYVPQVKDSKV